MTGTYHRNGEGDYKCSHEYAAIKTQDMIVLIKTFKLINIGKRAGSSIPNIYMFWNQQNWQLPTIKESFEPDRITLSLEIKEPADKIAVIIEYLIDKPTAKDTEISELIGSSDRRTREILKMLIDKNIVTIEESRNNSVHMLKR